MTTSRNKINAVLYTGFDVLTSRARHLRHNRCGLNWRYTIFNRVIRGAEVLDKIIAYARNKLDNPLKPIPMTVTVKE